MITLQQVSARMREKGYNHISGNQWGRLTGKRKRPVIYAYAIGDNERGYLIDWQGESL